MHLFSGSLECQALPFGISSARRWILTRPSRECTGNFFIDEDLLRSAGTTDFAKYQVVPGAELIPDFFI